MRADRGARRGNRLAWTLVFLSSSAAYGQTSTPPTPVVADARELLLAIPVPGKTPEVFVAPSYPDLEVWHLICDLAWNGQFLDASTFAASVGYECLEVHDPDRQEVLYVFREKAAPGEPGFRAQGIFCFRPGARRRLVIEAPHPRYDLDTKKEAIDAFLQTGAAALFIAGCHRKNSSALSPCTNGTYHLSDGAHWDGHFFQFAHQAVADAEPTAVFLQLHGYGKSYGEQAILSQGTRDAADPLGFLARLEHHLEVGEGLRVDVYPSETKRYGARRNVQGRYSNGVLANPCGQNATHATGTFCHLEQIRSLRRDPAPVIRAIDRAAADLWP